MKADNDEAAQDQDQGDNFLIDFTGKNKSSKKGKAHNNEEQDHDFADQNMGLNKRNTK